MAFRHRRLQFTFCKWHSTLAMVYWLFGLVEVENGCVRLFVAVVSGENGLVLVSSDGNWHFVAERLLDSQ